MTKFSLSAAWRRSARPEAVINRAYASWRQPQAKASRAPEGLRISLVLPVCDTNPTHLAEAIASVRAQTYTNWQLCIADDASTDAHIAPALAGAADADLRITTLRLPRRAGIAAASNAALRLATGAYVGFLDHDDLLAPHALARMAAAIVEHPQADLLFSDEDQLSGTKLCAPYFKPGFDPELLLAQNLVGHLALYRRGLLDRLGGFASGLDGSQDWDLALRATRAIPAARIRHVPDVLYHWRQHAASFSTQAPDRARQAGLRAVQAQLPPGTAASPDPALPQWLRVTHPLPTPAPTLSVIVRPGFTPPEDPDYPAFEVVEGGLSAAARATGQVLLFVCAGLHAPAPGWAATLVAQTMRPEVGAAGPRIDHPDGRIAQSGLILHPRRIAETLSPDSDAADPGYRGQFGLTRSVSALSLDCLAVRRDAFQAAGGLDAAFGPYAGVDLCLRLARAGLRCVWTPQARLRYAKRPRPAADPEAARLMQARWGDILARDPYLNPNLTVRNTTLALAPRQAAQRKAYDS